MDLIDQDKSQQIVSLGNPEELAPNTRLMMENVIRGGDFGLSVDLNLKPSAGNLWRLSSKYKSSLMIKDVTISNGLAWSHDKDFLLHRYSNATSKKIQPFRKRRLNW